MTAAQNAAAREGGAFRKEIIGDATLILGDCRDVLPTLDRACSVVSDPPYGMDWNTDSSRFSGGELHHRKRRDPGRSDWPEIHGDDQPFDPTPWLEFRACILWGANHYAARLPVGTTLVWIKRLDAAFGSFLSDAEVGWQKGGHGVYCKRDLTNYALTSERAHPTQKPIGLMEWCIARAPPTGTILDPFMGSGSTGVAALQLGRRFIGIEREPQYFDAARRRIAEAHAQPRLFSEPEPKPVQGALL